MKHRSINTSFVLKVRRGLVSNGEYLDFIKSGGYSKHEIWHSDGWDWIQKTRTAHPLYWIQLEGQWFEYDLGGLQPLNLEAPVRHINFYEASAFARSEGKRLPTEFEWEHAARLNAAEDLHQTLWQWTASAYTAYPGHQWKAGALGEYNSKFMVNQMVLRGSSAWTPSSHSRITYRNYFQPEKQWPFTGIRLAEDMS